MRIIPQAYKECFDNCFSGDGFIYHSQPVVIKYAIFHVFYSVSAARARVLYKPSAVSLAAESEAVLAVE
jgi:hypothetical protein